MAGLEVGVVAPHGLLEGEDLSEVMSLQHVRDVAEEVDGRGDADEVDGTAREEARELLRGHAGARKGLPHVPEEMM
ncbi:hypothetical protein D3C72_2001580 [compost metagenome]